MEDKGNWDVFMEMSVEQLKEETLKLTDLEILKQIESCKFECEAGPLENNMDWIELKERAKSREVFQTTPVEECKKFSYVDKMKLERDNLKDKVSNLDKFKETDLFKGLDDFQKEQLFIQCHLMDQYLKVLDTRIIYEGRFHDIEK